MKIASKLNMIGKLIANPKYTLRRLSTIQQQAGAYRELLIDQQYYWLYDNIKPDTTLLDFGAFIGDTAFYFAMNKYVKHIYAYESEANLFETAKKYIEKSYFKDKIDLALKKLDESNVQKILSEHGDKLAIKCDIEGAEYGIFTDHLDMHNVYAFTIACHVYENRSYTGIDVDNLIRAISKKGFYIEREDWRIDASADGIYAIGDVKEIMLHGIRK